MMVQEELNGVDGFTQTVMPCRLTGHANTTTWSFHVTHVPAFPTHQASDNHFATIARFLKDLAGIGCMDSIQREAVFGSIQSSSWFRVKEEINPQEIAVSHRALEILVYCNHRTTYRRLLWVSIHGLHVLWLSKGFQENRYRLNPTTNQSVK
jgi:hypothetical protein